MGATSFGSAVATAALCAVAGATATLPLYATFWWWDLLAHALAGAAIAAVGRLCRLSHAVGVGVVTATAIGWEVVEPHVPTASLPITFVTGDAPSDVVATVFGGVVVVGVVIARRRWTVR